MSSGQQGGRGKRRRQARAELHGERPVVQVGKGGLTGAVVASAEEALAARELIKVQVGKSCPVDPQDAAQALAAALRAEVVGVVGRQIMLSRPRPAAEQSPECGGAIRATEGDTVMAPARRPPSRPGRGS